MHVRLARFAMVGVLALFTTATALAQEAQPGDPDPAGALPDEEAAPDEATPEETGPDAAPESAAPVPIADPAPAAPAAPYPQRALDRPRTLPGGAFQGALQVNTAELDATGALAQLLYSPVEKLQTAVTYTFGIDPAAFDGQVALAARYYSYKGPPHLFHSVQLTVPLNFAEDAMGERTPFQRINLSSPIKYKFNDTFGAFFGDDLLDVFFDPEFDLALNVPFEVAVQANDHIFASVATNFARIGLTNGDLTQHLGDRVPLKLTGLYAFNYTMDVVAIVNFGDVTAVGDVPVVAIVGVNYRGGFGR